MHVRLEIVDEYLRGKLKVFALLAPHIGGKGWDNHGAIDDHGERALMCARREGLHLVFGCDRGFLKHSVGYVSTSDGWTDIRGGCGTC